MIGDVFDLNLKLSDHGLNEALRVELGKEDDYMRQGHLILFEDVFRYGKPPFHYEVIETLFFLKLHILFSGGSPFEVVLKKEIADLEPSGVQLPLNKHFDLETRINLRELKENFDAGILPC